MKRYSLYILTFVSLLISCTDIKEDYISPNKGKEVAFSASVENGNHKSRTVYGSEITSEDGSSVVVNWVDGDKITVYAPDCSVMQANYSIVTDGKKQNYANDLVKEGAAGIQWGTSEGSAFYAIYPNVKDDFFVNEEDGYTTARTQVNSVQYVDFGSATVEGTWVGTPYMVGQDGEQMPNALMYAYSSFESSMDDEGNPREVNLRFKPYSTVLKFTINGWEAGNSMGDYNAGTKVEVKKITLESPYTIAGECLFGFPESENGEPSVNPVESSASATNIIELYPKKNVLLGEGEKMEFSIFAIPQEGYVMDPYDNWTVSLETDYGVFEYKMAPKEGSNAELLAGQIHKIAIPTLEINTGAVKLDASQWLRYIPRNVYLSELSVPGSWYATNGDYQSTTDLTLQYKQGIRAFNIDCRMSPSSFEVDWKLNKTYGDLELVCAGTDKWATGGPGAASILYNPYTKGTPVIDKLEEIAEEITDDEFVYIILTIAEKPLSSSGNVYGGATVDPSIVLPEIYKILATNAENLKLYTSKIDPDTTVDDVLGHMIVKVNVNTTPDNFLGYSGKNNDIVIPEYALVSEGSMASDPDFISSPIVVGSFNKMNEATMYWNDKDTGLKYYYHHAQMTKNDTQQASTDATPSFKDRMKAIDEIIDMSSEIYKKNKHNALFQISVGGRLENDDRTSVASTLNPYILKLVNEKLNSSPSPVGIVLMNYCTNNSYSSIDLVNAIIEMNTRFYLNRDINKKEWPNGDNPWDTTTKLPTEGDGDLGNS